MDAAVVGIAVSPPQPTQLTFEDGLGERRYAVGAVNEPLEVLKLSSVLSAVSSFDFALRERAARLTGFRHDAFARVRSIELDRRTSGLLVTSDYITGVRLSTVLAEVHKRGTPIELNAVRCLVRQLVSAAAALHGWAPDVANGAIAPERLVLTPSGRLVIVEYVLGAALEQLAYPRARYWRELGVALPASIGAPTIDARADVMQIGAVALALILGRPLTPEDYPEQLPDLIQRAHAKSLGSGAEPLPASVRDWLMQALQLDQWESFASPADARAALDEAFGSENVVVETGALQVFLSRYAANDVPAEPDLGPRLEAMKAFLARYPPRRAAAKPDADTPEPAADAPAPPAPAAEPARADVAPEPPPAAVPEAAVADPPELARVESAPALAPEPATAPAEGTGPIPSYAEKWRGATPVLVSRRLRLVAAAAALMLLFVAIGAVFYVRGGSAPTNGTLSVTTSPPGITVLVDGMPHGVTPLGVELPPGQHVIELKTGTEQRRIPITLTAGGQVSQYFEFAATPQATGELLVRTDPIGAAVTVDGNYVGRAPVSVPDLAPGTHTVVMQQDGETRTERVIIENGRTASLVVSMGAGQKLGAAGWLRVDVPADVQVLENGRRVGASDLDRIMLPVGRHDLEFVNESLGYRERRAVQIAAGQTSSIRPEWPRGTMALNAIPWAEVLVDGQRVGETPLGSVAVPIGTHEVVFRHPELGERRVSVTVTTGEPVKVGVDLRSK